MPSVDLALVGAPGSRERKKLIKLIPSLRTYQDYLMRAYGLRWEDLSARLVAAAAGTVMEALEQTETANAYHGSPLPWRLILRRVRLDRGGYAKDGGQYFGAGAPVFSLEHESGNPVGLHDLRVFRAADRSSAMAKVRDKYPNAKFVS